ncbi:UDP-glucose 4-epimerase GalE [Rhodobaculum claviforme]|uniref:UDP-glucose 4-epimerase n=1 Tax=Rhodobaculum claviforme TaxID=1549854 RepID=A0A934TN49_9RHOB|nr:UDP-glucose 4-epimerase GalE [Rhodobaculum claviforme]MBK5928596.1 UDP-glucose 4-epimerase GalE [Rhodobaculum claviforme]
MAQSVLLTGGAGYIGSHTWVALREAGFHPVILDDFSNAAEDLPERLRAITGTAPEIWRGSVLDADQLGRIFAAHDIAAVIHFAARKAVGESVRMPLEYVQTNLGGLTTLLEAMRAAGVFRLVFSSSATVYGVPDRLPIPEDAPTGFTNPYGFTKLAGEQVLQQLAASDPRWAIGILRYFNPAGAHASGRIGEDPRDVPNNLMPFIARVAVGDLPALQVFGDDYDTPDGTGVRDYIHVEDLAEGHLRSLSALLDGGGGHVVNLGTGQGYSVLEMLAAYGRACGRVLPHVIAPRRAGDIAACYADPTRAADVLGFRARRGLEEMCVSSWRWISWRTGREG